MHTSAQKRGKSNDRTTRFAKLARAKDSVRVGATQPSRVSNEIGKTPAPDVKLKHATLLKKNKLTTAQNAP